MCDAADDARRQRPLTLCQVVFVHPIHNFTVVEYSPELIGSTPVLSATCSEVALLPGDQVKFVGLTSQLALVHATSAVTQIEKLKNSPGKIPYFRDTNIRVIQLVRPPSTLPPPPLTLLSSRFALFATLCQH